MLHEAATDNMLKELTRNTGQGHRPIIGWVCLVAFLVNRVYIGMLPYVREGLLVYICLKKQSKDWGQFRGQFFEHSWSYAIWASSFRDVKSL